ncbi:MAG: phosphoribosylformimino-5-aminoimidazole carboxamide ribotide isomerase [Lachnospiraceae bacterium]|nr:phosphoribosylformimino-5-aminoimidazole carboxamide ribotide isomerase [Lachnospiraceae bacterium]
MEFRPCIDIHNGRVKQIVGGSLSDAGNQAEENFVSELRAEDYARLYKERGLSGGHIILLNAKESKYYQADLSQAEAALKQWPDALQIGGGVTEETAASFIEMGASHVIVTSYVFADGEIHMDRLEKLIREVGKEHLVLDVSCRKKDGVYYIVTDRWQKFTNQSLDGNLLRMLASYCDEFLVHAVNVEGTKSGVDQELIRLLSEKTEVPITYAGGIGTLDDIETIRLLGKGNIHFTVGSALDLFGGTLKFEEIINKFCE